MLSNDNLMVFLLKTCQNHKYAELIGILIEKIEKVKTPEKNKDILVSIGEILLSED